MICFLIVMKKKSNLIITVIIKKLLTRIKRIKELNK